MFGTLVDWRSSVARAFAAAGVDGDPTELADDWRARLRAGARRRPTAASARRPRATELHGGDARRPASTARGIGRGTSQHAPLCCALARARPMAGRPEGLELLRRDRVTATLSNGHVALLVDLARHGDMRFDAILSARARGRVQARARGLPDGRAAAGRHPRPSSCSSPAIPGTSRAPAAPDCRRRSSTGRSSTARDRPPAAIPRPTCPWRACPSSPSAYSAASAA